MTNKVLFPALLLLTAMLTGCTYGMHQAIWGHSDEPTETPEEMTKSSQYVINRMEQYCLDSTKAWKGNSCRFTFNTQWDFWGRSGDWFEAMTRGIDTFDHVLKEHYPIVAGGHVVSYYFRKGWDSTQTRSWRYVLGDGSTILTIDRTWKNLPNEVETAIVEEQITFVIGFESSHPCLKSSSYLSVRKCEGFMDSLHKTPEQFQEADLSRTAASIKRVNTSLAYLAAKGDKSSEASKAYNQMVAEQKKRDSEAVSAGIHQGLANFDTSVKTLPTYSHSNTNNYVPRPNLSKQYAQIQPTYMDRMEKREQTLATMKNATQAGNKTTTAPSVASAASSQPSTNGTTVQANPTQQTGANAKPISTARTKDFKEAIAYCWTLKEPKSGQKDIWFCHGPIQKTLVATTLPKAMELVGCDYPNALRKWDFKDGVVHACDLGLENYDEDVANLYQVPSVITKNLHQYRCNLPYQGRCRTTL
ncbi:hypothetical protein ABXZ88_003815 [Vibrio fluvialis]